MIYHKIKKRIAGITSQCILLSALFMNTAYATEDTGTIYTKDGSVLQGEIVKDNSGNYMIYTKYGDNTVKPEDVILLMNKSEKFSADVVETFILSNESQDVISIFQKEIPEFSEKDSEINFLIPGKAEAIYDQENAPVQFTKSDIGAFSKISIKTSDYQSKGRKIFITTHQENYLEKDPDGNIVFKYQFVPEIELSFKMILKYPQTWKIIKSSPEISSQNPGLSIWQKNLKKQQNFSPEIKFKME